MKEATTGAKGNLALDATVAASNLALDATAVASPTAPTQPSQGAGGLRTTVLPATATPTNRSSLAPQARVRYEQEALLGVGGMGEVVRARDNDIERRVALKRLREDARQPGMLLRFVEEIRTVGQLEHPNIVPIHDVGVDDKGDYFFVMKYVDGETLADIIAKLAAGDPAYHAKYTCEHRVRIFMGILEAMAYAHSRGVIHRDLKPANVMVGAYGEVVVMDWGVAKRSGSPDASTSGPLPAVPADGRLVTTQAGAVIGTPAYMAPEQIRGEAADARCDIYALCVLFFELLTLQHYLAEEPDADSALRAITHKPAPLAAMIRSPHQPPVPPELTWYVDKGLQKNPADRYQSIADMIERLQRRNEGDFPVQCRATFMKHMMVRLTRFTERHVGLAMLAAGLAAVSVLGAVLAVVVGLVVR